MLAVLPVDGFEIKVLLGVDDRQSEKVYMVCAFFLDMVRAEV